MYHNQPHPTATILCVEVTILPPVTSSNARAISSTSCGTGILWLALPKRNAGRAIRTTPNRLATQVGISNDRNNGRATSILTSSRRLSPRESFVKKDRPGDSGEHGREELKYCCVCHGQVLERVIQAEDAYEPVSQSVIIAFNRRLIAQSLITRKHHVELGRSVLLSVPR